MMKSPAEILRSWAAVADLDALERQADVNRLTESIAHLTEQRDEGTAQAAALRAAADVLDDAS